MTVCLELILRLEQRLEMEFLGGNVIHASPMCFLACATELEVYVLHVKTFSQNVSHFLNSTLGRSIHLIKDGPEYRTRTTPQHTF